MMGAEGGAVGDVTGFLEETGVDFDVLEHEHTERAADEAKALGVAAEEVAKTLVLASPSGNLRAVLPASERIDLGKVADLLDAPHKEVHLASEDNLKRDYPDFDLGAVPPFGGKEGDRVIIDSRLAARDSVVLEAGSHERSVRLKAADLVRLTQAEVSDICKLEERTAG
jgi:Ala-tRNA(Pro) deacylase